MLNREEIASNKAAVAVELLDAFIPPISWLWFVAVNAAGFKAIFRTNRAKALVMAVFCFLVLTVLGIL